MTKLNIRRGLRRLDFTPPTSASERTTHVVVEFARGEPLSNDQIVSINLGIRSGINTMLEGLPKLVKPMTAARGSEFVYRIEGRVP